MLVLLNGTADSQTTPESTELVNLLKRNGVKYVALDLNKRTDLAPIFTQPVPSVFVQGAFLGDLPSIKQLEVNNKLLAAFPADSV